MKKEVIKIKGAKVHNLKNVSVDIPRNKLVVITGISGSGKSSLAFDTLYAEGQRRYVESLSVYARQFLGIMDKPDVEKIEGISPAISIDQKKAGHNPRSNVGTITEIYDYFRLLFSKVGKPHCPECKKPISRQTVDQIVEQVLKLLKKSEIIISAPTSCSLEQIKRKGFVRVRIDGNVYFINKIGKDVISSNFEVVIDSFVLDKDLDRSRLKDSLAIGLRMGNGKVIVNNLVFSTNFTCEKCNIFIPELEPRFFSFNNPYGACLKCKGLGEKLEIDPELIIPNPNLTIHEGAIMSYRYSNQLSELAKKYNFFLDKPVKSLPKKILNIIFYGDNNFEGVIPSLERKYHETNSDWTRKEIEQYMVKRQCPECSGKRLKREALAVSVNNKSIDEVVEMPISETKLFFEKEFPKIAQPIVKEILIRLQFLIDVGLDYLCLDRKAITLAGGEGQRIRLATQIGSKLTGVLYILDEPSIGLHSRDQARLIKILKKLRDLGNTVIVVEHDNKIIRAADWIIDVGPGAGKQGGRIMFEGTSGQLMKSNTLTGKYLSGKLKVNVALESPELKTQNYLTIKGATEHNLKNIDVRIPFNKFVCITGVSGSGKSSLMNDILAKALLKKFYHAKQEPGKHKKILGTEFLNKVVLVDQSPIGRTPRSNPATYTGAFSYIRELFSKTKESGTRGYSSGRFSFNVKGGRCEACEGQGQIKVEMYFLPDVYIECKKCKGKRYNIEALEIEYNNKNIAEVLEMTVEESLDFFKNIPGLYQKLKTLKQVGLSYIQLGQSAPSLSGGEAQRVKLATELSRKSFGRTLYILDEPTTGLHPDDIKKLVLVLKKLVEKGNTVLIIEHNLDIVRSADWVIDLGPEGGDKGGHIVAQGTPKDIAKNETSYTGRYLRKA